ncbi:MAG TPA: hypothetical protein VFE62_00375 [Gemmataceae bacterium]|nr:hypothetical protein [Gemmataceae bacterium]
MRGCWVVDALVGREAAVRVGLISHADWLVCADPEPLIAFLRDKGTDRQWRRYAVECCRRIAHLLPDECCRRALQAASDHAHGKIGDEELAAAHTEVEKVVKQLEKEDYEAEAKADFCLTATYAKVLRRKYAAYCAHYASSPDPRTGSIRAADESRTNSDTWAVAAVGINQVVESAAGIDTPVGRETRRAEQAAELAELNAQCNILRKIFADQLGPIGLVSAWLPSGTLRREKWWSNAEQWCLLPTPIDERN